jgi:hypothetical protein
MWIERGAALVLLRGVKRNISNQSFKLTASAADQLHVRETSMKNMIYISCLVFVSLWLVGCGERSAEIDNPRAYNNAGLEFEYPRNWKVTEDIQQGELRYLFVESPGNALLIIQIVSADDALDIQDFAKSFTQSAKEETPIGNFTGSVFGSVNKSGGYEILTEQLSIALLGEKIPHTRTYRRKPVANRVCFIIAQVADEDLLKVTKGFELVFSSFMYRIP